MDRLPSGCLTALVAVQGGRDGDNDVDDDVCMARIVSLAAAELTLSVRWLSSKVFNIFSIVRLLLLPVELYN